MLFMNTLSRIASSLAATFTGRIGTAHVDTSTNEMFVRELVKDINKAMRSIDIVESGDNIGFYNDHRVIAAFKSAFDRGVKIRLVVKPILDETGDQMKARDS